MKITLNDLRLDKDYPKKRAHEMKLYELNLELPEGLEATGISKNNRILIRKDLYT